MGLMDYHECSGRSHARYFLFPHSFSCVFLSFSPYYLWFFLSIPSPFSLFPVFPCTFHWVLFTNAFCILETLICQACVTNIGTWDLEKMVKKSLNHKCLTHTHTNIHLGLYMLSVVLLIFLFLQWYYPTFFSQCHSFHPLWMISDLSLTGIESLLW